MSQPTFEQIAQVAHETNRAFMATLNDDTIKPFAELKKPELEAIVSRVQEVYEHPEVTPSIKHEKWLESQKEAGWKFGETLDEAKKESPRMVPYYKLPTDEQRAEALFRGVVFMFREQAETTVN